MKSHYDKLIVIMTLFLWVKGDVMNENKIEMGRANTIEQYRICRLIL